jgi:hypothetical protein
MADILSKPPPLFKWVMPISSRLMSGEDFGGVDHETDCSRDFH